MLLALNFTVVYPNDGKIRIESPFCSGFTEGYKNGYCYNRAACFCPYVPFCPTPMYPFSSESFADGYNIGFYQALNER